MAPIAIIFSSTIGFFTGIVQFTFFGASLGQAFVTYFVVSIALSMLALATAMISDRTRALQSETAQANTLESWHDWQTEEEMAAARVANSSHDAVQDLPIGRKSA